jgi:hypothetical protein
MENPIQMGTGLTSYLMSRSVNPSESPPIIITARTAGLDLLHRSREASSAALGRMEEGEGQDVRFKLEMGELGR